MNNTTLFGKVAVLMGGNSAERSISLESGTAVLKALQSQGVDAHGIDVGKDIVDVLSAGKFDRVFIVLHGRGGEDGTMQGMLEVMGLPYTGSRVLGAALSMDKLRCKQIWLQASLPTPQYMTVNESTNWSEVVNQLGLPLIIKPNREGSSFGVSLVKESQDLVKAWKEANEYDTCVIAEKYIVGGEYTVPILDGNVLPMIKMETDREFYDYEAKYQSDDTRYICPCGLDAELEKHCGEIALQAYELIDASGWGRVDVMIDESKRPWLIEVNTVPGMTDHSLVPMAAKQVGTSFEDLCLQILATTESSSLQGGA